MNLRNMTLTSRPTPNVEKDPSLASLYNLPKYAFCTSLGLISGATSVALTIGIAIIVQLSVPPTVTVTPQIQILTLTLLAMTLSIGSAKLFGRSVPRLLPRLFDPLDDHQKQIMLTAGVLTSLMETLSFFSNL